MIIGLTGPSGAGKSEVASVFKKHGFFVVDADKTAHIVYETNRECAEQIRREFGDDVAPNGKVDRKALADAVFSSKDALKRLNELVHPYIVNHIRDEIGMSKARYILLDAPLLFESGLSEICDCSVGVLASYFIRKDRIIKRDNLKPEAAEKRLKSQPSDEFYRTNCDRIIYNNGSKKRLENQTDDFLADVLNTERGK